MDKITHILTFLIVIWFLSIVSFATWIVLTNPVEIPLSAVTVLSTIYAIPAIAAGLWKWSGDKMIQVILDDKVTGTQREIMPNERGTYIVEYDPKRHVLNILSR